MFGKVSSSSLRFEFKMNVERWEIYMQKIFSYDLISASNNVMIWEADKLNHLPGIVD